MYQQNVTTEQQNNWRHFEALFGPLQKENYCIYSCKNLIHASMALYDPVYQISRISVQCIYACQIAQNDWNRHVFFSENLFHHSMVLFETYKVVFSVKSKIMIGWKADYDWLKKIVFVWISCKYVNFQLYKPTIYTTLAAYVNTYKMSI